MLLPLLPEMCLHFFFFFLKWFAFLQFRTGEGTGIFESAATPHFVVLDAEGTFFSELAVV